MADDFRHTKGWLSFADDMVGQATGALGCLAAAWLLLVFPVLLIAVAIKWLFG